MLLIKSLRVYLQFGLHEVFVCKKAETKNKHSEFTCWRSILFSIRNAVRPIPRTQQASIDSGQIFPSLS